MTVLSNSNRFTQVQDICKNFPLKTQNHFSWCRKLFANKNHGTTAQQFIHTQG